MKTLKHLVTCVLLLFVAASVGTLIAKEVGRETSDIRSEERLIPLVIDASAQGEPCRLIACYFHNTDRCSTCLEIERMARDVVESEFSAELSDGRLIWVALNMEEPANRPYVDLFDLAMPTLVLLRLRGETIESWTPLNDTWGLVRSAVRFSMYVEDHVRRLLRGCP